MKKLLLIILIFSISTLIYGQKLVTGKNAYNLVKDANTVRIKKFSEVPNYISFINGKEPSFSDIFEILNTTSKNKVELSLINSAKKDELGFQHHRYNQIINGYIVEQSMYIIHEKDGKVSSVNGELYSTLPNTNSPTISFPTALYIAKGNIGASIYKWENPDEELFIKEITEDNTSTYMPQKELVYISKDGNLNEQLRLAYKLDIYAHKPMSRTEVYIDAQDGSVLFKNDLIHTADVTGTASTGYSGSRTITADSFSGSYRLRETGRGNGIETYNRNQGVSGGSDFIDNDNNWANFNAQEDEYATDAHWGAEMTYDYYLNVHNRNSIDDNGFKLRSYVHHDVNYGNAFWNNQYMTYGDGYSPSQQSILNKPLTVLDICGHEITHGLVSNTAGLIYSYESGALNESFADIFGVTIDFWARPSLGNWIMGEESSVSGTGYIRNMANPNDKGHPDTYLGQLWHTASSDNGGVHKNSGVQNFWYYLLVNGGNGTNDNNDQYNVGSIGMTSASEVAFRNLTVYLTSSSQYSDARFYAIKSATDLFGPCSPEVEATTNAWYAVGVGPAYVVGVNSDFVASGTSGCNVPFTVNFSNLSNNATTYSWDFGDGGTSTLANPNHTYTAAGIYTVQLIADGGACGNDTEIKTAYIDIDPNNPCPVILPPGGTAPVQTSCSGILFDDGGPGGIYAANQETYVEISPIGASQVTLNFSSFDVEGFTGCGYDYLEIFDGTSTSAPSLGKFCNTNNPPPTSISSSGGSIFLHFHTDQGAHLNGFQIDWSCVQGGNPLPTAQFSGSPTTVCTGNTVTYSNSSVNATSYSWSFPGGTPATSSAATPSVTYNTPGTYDVELIATNASGSDTLLSTNYISVTTNCPIILPPNTTHPTQTACTGTIFDDGGSSNEYTPNQDSYITISPTGATSVSLSFILFDVESGAGSQTPPCGYDYVEIFDGPSTSSPSLGKFCNGNTPPPTVTSSGGDITIHFHTDPGLHLQGFQIDWQCSTTNPSPVANFSSSSTLACLGNSINFYDQSLNNPTSWAWTFTGGSPSTSTVQNPSVTYNSPGIYDVTLTATNANGSDTKSRTHHITVFSNLIAAFNSSPNGLAVNFSDLSSGATSWSWDFGDASPASTTQNPLHTYAVAGTYNVCLTIDNPSCTSNTKCNSISISTAGIEEDKLFSNLKIFPNPTNSIINIDVEFKKENQLDIKIIDIVGKVIFNEKSKYSNKKHKKSIDLSNYSSGSYVLYINNIPHKINRE